MDYIEQVLAELGEGSKLTITYHWTAQGNQFHGLIVDSTGEIFDARSHSMDTLIGALDDLAEEWLSELEQ
jgi:hypothetical protein